MVSGFGCVAMNGFMSNVVKCIYFVIGSMKIAIENSHEATNCHRKGVGEGKKFRVPERILLESRKK